MQRGPFPPRRKPAVPQQPKKPVDPKLTAAALLIAVAAVGGVFWFVMSRARPQTLPPARTVAPAPVRPAATPLTPPQPVAIQDGKTLDFSGGRPVVKDSTADKAVIAQAVKEMDEAAAEVTFGSRAAAPTSDPKKPAPKN